MTSSMQSAKNIDSQTGERKTLWQTELSPMPMPTKAQSEQKVRERRREQLQRGVGGEIAYDP